MSQTRLTMPAANLDRADLLRVQASDFISHLAIAYVPEPQGAIKVTRADDVLVPSAAHRVAAAVTDDGAHTEALVQVPYFDASVCAAADGPQGVAWAAVHTAHLQMPNSFCCWFQMLMLVPLVSNKGLLSVLKKPEASQPQASQP